MRVGDLGKKGERGRGWCGFGIHFDYEEMAKRKGSLR